MGCGGPGDGSWEVGGGDGIEVGAISMAKQAESLCRKANLGLA